MMLNANEIAVLRELATKYTALAAHPSQEKTRQLWYALNRRDMKKPMVLINQMPWRELSCPELVCKVEDRYWRRVENWLRQSIYKMEHLPVDMVLTPYILLSRPIGGCSVKDYGLIYEVKRIGCAQEFTDVLQTEEDLEKIHKSTVTWDRAREEEIKHTAHMLFDGICEFRMKGANLHCGIWDFVSFAKSVTNCYLDLYDRPEFMHAIMRRLTDCILDTIDQLNAIKGFDIASTLTHCSHNFTDELPIGMDEATSDQAWAMGMAQLFTSVSPDITEEFEIPYLQEIYAKFGAVYYGCCERLDDRLELIEKLPNVRKVSCSPWSDRERFAERLSKKYIMSNKPSPALLATDTFDEQLVREDLRRTMDAAKRYDVPLEMILKDISTVRNDPARLWRWAEIAAEETANF